jgi:hypothetical protein
MQIQLINRTDPERVLINVKNVEASSLTTGYGVCLAIGNEDVAASADGVNAVMFTTSAELLPSFIGVAKSDIASNAYGPIIGWGFADSIALSQEANVTVGLLAGQSLLIPGAGAGTFTSAGAAWEALSTLAGKYVINAMTQSTNGGINYTKGFVRAI